MKVVHLARSTWTLFSFLISCFWPLVHCASADPIDAVILRELSNEGIPGLSLAVIDKGKIVKARGYGFTTKAKTKPVTVNTLFQAASISKPVAAIGALQLVEKGSLSLDENINNYLKSWKVPDGDLTKRKPVTLRLLLCHRSGLNVHGFPGYNRTTVLPSIRAILEGKKPANTAAVRVVNAVGTKRSYSGGGYVLLQQAMTDVTGKPFATLMSELVLDPFRMNASTYEQPLPIEKHSLAATGYLKNGMQVNGSWHVYPERAAAGLWTTPTDLAKFLLSVQTARKSKTSSFLPKQVTSNFLSKQDKRGGLGVYLRGKRRELQFYHSGRNAGFDCYMSAYAKKRKGIVLMINANSNKNIFKPIIEAVRKSYDW